MAESHDSAGPDPTTEDISGLWERVLPLFTTIEGRLDRTLTRLHGVGLAPLRTLGEVVSCHPGSATVGEIARRLGVSVSSASRTLTQLERSGWVSRVAWPCDRRISRVAATETGRDIWARASRTLDRELDAVFRVLAFDEKYAHVVARLCRAGRPPAGAEPPPPSEPGPRRTGAPDERVRRNPDRP